MTRQRRRSRRLPWTLVNPVIGIFLSTGAPAGWFLLRWASHLLPPSPTFLGSLHLELEAHGVLYAYMYMGTALTLVFGGIVVGIRDDRIQKTLQKLLSQKRLLGMKNRQLARLSITDRLTGLANYFRLHEMLSLEFKRARRYGLELCVILVDIDHFKRINDTHGHLFGDYVLHELGQVFASSRRETDYVARTGGEEFCFVLTETSAADATKFAERLRDEVAQHHFEYRGIKTSVTLSAGVASVHEVPSHVEDESGKILLEFADDALYDAKRAGRNRVVRFRPKPAEFSAAG